MLCSCGSKQFFAHRLNQVPFPATKIALAGGFDAIDETLEILPQIALARIMQGDCWLVKFISVPG